MEHPDRDPPDEADEGCAAAKDVEDVIKETRETIQRARGEAGLDACHVAVGTPKDPRVMPTGTGEWWVRMVD